MPAPARFPGFAKARPPCIFRLKAILELPENHACIEFFEILCLLILKEFRDIFVMMRYESLQNN